MRETIFEWVVETLDEDDDIVDCSYWPETERANADGQYEILIADGKRIDFAICRRVCDDEKGDRDRQYLYREADGTWPGRVMDGGAVVPPRIEL